MVDFTTRFSEVLKFVMSFKDALHRKPWSILVGVAEDIFEEIQSAKWHREAPSWELPKQVELTEIVSVMTWYLKLRKM